MESSKKIPNTADLDLRFVKLETDPYQQKDVIFDVDMDHFAILLPDKTLLLFDMVIPVDIKTKTMLDAFGASEIHQNVDFLCTRGVRTCIGTYGEVKFGPSKIRMLAHVSALTSLNFAMTYMHEVIAHILATPPEALSVDFLLYGGTKGVFKDLAEEEPLAAPQGCYVDATSRILNTDSDDENLGPEKDEGDSESEAYEENISIFLCLEKIVVQQINGPNPPIIYSQDYQKTSQLILQPGVLGKRKSERALENTSEETKIHFKKNTSVLFLVEKHMRMNTSARDDVSNCSSVSGAFHSKTKI